MRKLNLVEKDEKRHKCLIISTNIVSYIIIPVMAVIFYVWRDAPTNSVIWQDYIISFILYISPLLQCYIIKHSRNKKIGVEQIQHNSFLGRWNAAAKVTHEGVSDNLKQEIYDLKMKCAFLEEYIKEHRADIDNQEIKINTIARLY